MSRTLDTNERQRSLLGVLFHSPSSVFVCVFETRCGTETGEPLLARLASIMYQHPPVSTSQL